MCRVDEQQVSSTIEHDNHEQCTLGMDRLNLIN